MERILRQKDHMAMALKRLEQMYINGHGYDTTIICSDGELGAHFLVLRIFSSFAENVEWIHNRGMILFPEARKSDIQRILDIIYLGKTTVQKNDVKRIIETASLMKINVQEETCDDQDSETPDLLTFSCRGDQNNANCGKTPVCESTSNPLIDKNVAEPLPSTKSSLQILSVHVFRPTDTIQMSREDSMSQVPITIDTDEQGEEEASVSISTGKRGMYVISSSDSEDQDETAASKDTSRHQNDTASSSKNTNQRKPAWMKKRKRSTDAPPVIQGVETEEFSKRKASLLTSKDTSRHQNDSASSSKNTNQRKPAWMKRRKRSTDAPPVIQGVETEEESSIIRTKKPSSTEILQMCRALRKEPMPEELRRNILERKIDLTIFCVKCRKICHPSHFKEHSRNPGKKEQCRLCGKIFHNDVLMRIHLPCRGYVNI